MPAYTPTTPPYKDQNIYVCDIVDIRPEDDDVKVGRKVRRDTYLYLKREMGDDITVTEIRLPDDSGPVVDPLDAVAVVNPTSGDVTDGPLTINYDGSTSTGLIVSWLWELSKDAGPYGFVSNDVASSFGIVAPGSYNLRLTVTDTGDATDTHIVPITVT